jgi:hypothetical protein
MNSLATKIQSVCAKHTAEEVKSSRFDLLLEFAKAFEMKVSEQDIKKFLETTVPKKSPKETKAMSDGSKVFHGYCQHAKNDGLTHKQALVRWKSVKDCLSDKQKEMYASYYTKKEGPRKVSGKVRIEWIREWKEKNEIAKDETKAEFNSRASEAYKLIKSSLTAEDIEKYEGLGKKEEKPKKEKKEKKVKAEKVPLPEDSESDYDEE